MLYLIYGNSYLVKKELDRMVPKLLPESNEWNYFVYDALKIPFDEIIEQANTAGFFADKKLIIVKNSYFLTSEKVKLEYENDLEHLEVFLNNISSDVDIIFVTYAIKLDERLKIVKYLKKKCQVTFLNNPTKDEFIKKVKEMFALKKVTIDAKALNEFVLRINEDLERAEKEIDKLATFSNNISIDIIKEAIMMDMNTTVFNLADALIAKNLNRAMTIYQSLKNDIELNSLLSIIARQYRQVYQILVLSDLGLRADEIAQRIGLHPYITKLILERRFDTKQEELIKNIVALTDLDIDIKRGDYQVRFTKFELFLVSCCL